MAATTYSSPATTLLLPSQLRSPTMVSTMFPFLLGPPASHSHAGSSFIKAWPRPMSPASSWTASTTTGRGWLVPIRQAITALSHFLLPRRRPKIRTHREEESTLPHGQIARVGSGSLEVLV